MKPTRNAIFLAGAVLAGATFAVPLTAHALQDEPEKADTELPQIHEDLKDQYTLVGEGPTCIQTYRIQSTRVLDDQNILFEMRGGQDLLNILPRRCPRLSWQRSFTYVARNANLCDLDTITVFDPVVNINGPTCGLGPYYTLEEIKDDKKKDKDKKNDGK